jgi:hypothetical protein
VQGRTNLTRLVHAIVKDGKRVLRSRDEHGDMAFIVIGYAYV